jgi:hypothetical protein
MHWWIAQSRAVTYALTLTHSICSGLLSESPMWRAARTAAKRKRTRGHPHHRFAAVHVAGGLFGVRAACTHRARDQLVECHDSSWETPLY